jgi:hypothetical protein
MVALTDRARDALRSSLAAARRFDPEAHLRVIRQDGAVRAVFAEEPDPTDQVIDLDGASVGVQAGIEGTVDAGEHNELTVVGS